MSRSSFIFTFKKKNNNLNADTTHTTSDSLKLPDHPDAVCFVSATVFIPASRPNLRLSLSLSPAQPATSTDKGFIEEAALKTDGFPLTHCCKMKKGPETLQGFLPGAHNATFSAMSHVCVKEEKEERQKKRNSKSVLLWRITVCNQAPHSPRLSCPLSKTVAKTTY